MDRWDEIDAILRRAVAIRPEEISEFLNDACGSDLELREILGRMLDSACDTSTGIRPGGALNGDLAKAMLTELAVPDPMIKTPRELSHYELSTILGTGGMGIVYRARDKTLGRDVAIKILRHDVWIDDDGRERFVQEARAASALNHPGIVTVHELGRARVDDRDLDFMVMEHVDGQTLDRLIGAGGLAPPLAIDYGTQIASALSAAHGAGIVHRDLKPSNVITTKDNRVKVLDFGIAKLLSERAPEPHATSGAPSETRRRIVIGTAAHMSPEQARGDSVDARSDVFSFGTLLYEMLSGVRAFPRATTLDSAASVLENDFPERLSERGLLVPPELETILSRCLEKKADARYASARELHDDLARLGARASLRSTLDVAPVIADAERRRASVVVVTLGSYAELVEQLDPEEVENVMKQVRERVTGIIASHGGLLNQFDGEDIVSLFGIPAAHEDDSLRAIRASREIRTSLAALSREGDQRTGPGPTILVQTGVGTGQLVAVPLESESAKYKLAGDTVQLAKRLASQAAAGEILVGADTEKLIRPFFETERRGAVSTKRGGSRTRVYSVHEPSGAQTRLEAAKRSGLTAYTGRTRELETLRAALERSLRGEGQFITVVGEAGVGKSRLLYEFAHQMDRRAATLVNGRCQSYGGNVGYLPFIAALRELLGCDVANPSSTDVAARIIEIDTALQEYLPIYLHLLSIPHAVDRLEKELRDEDLRLAILDALSALFRSSSRQKPVVMLLEDWHWVDDASHAAIEHLIGITASCPLLLVVTYRTESPFDWPRLSRRASLRLMPLGAASAYQLIGSALEAAELPDGLADRIYERTGGNPFFVEEVCRALRETGTVVVDNGAAAMKESVQTLHVPGTIQAVIRSRLDRLDTDSEQLLRRASVIGRQFSRSLLERALPDQRGITATLETLERAALIQKVRTGPNAVFIFKHALTHEVAYDSLMPRRRKAFHAAVGAALEKMNREHRDEQLDRLMHHFAEAEDWRKAVHYGRAAAKRARALTQFRGALDTMNKVRHWLTRLPNDAERHEILVETLFEQDRLCEVAGERETQQDIVRELLSLLHETNDSRRLVTAYLRQSELLTILGRIDAAETALEESLSISRKTSNLVGERNALRSMGFLRWRQERHEEALALNEKAIAMDRRRGDDEAVCEDLHNLSAVLCRMERYDEALACLAENRALAQRIRNPERRAYALSQSGNLHRVIGDSETALDYHMQAAEVCYRHQLTLQNTFVLTSIANIHWERGEINRCLSRHEEIVAISRASHYAEGLNRALRAYGDVLHKLARHDEALPRLAEAAEGFARLKDPEAEAATRSLAARCYEARGLYDQARDAWDEVLRIRRLQGSGTCELIAVEGIARSIRAGSKDPSSSIAFYERALQAASKLEDRWKQGEILNTLGILRWKCRQYEQALAHYEAAHELFSDLGDEIHAGLILNSIGATLRSLARYDEATVTLEDAIRCHRRNGQPLLEGHALAQLGGVHADRNETERAVSRYQASLQIRQSVGDRSGEGWMRFRLAQLYVERKSRRARAELDRAVEIACDVEDGALREACDGLEAQMS